MNKRDWFHLICIILAAFFVLGGLYFEALKN